MNDTTDEKSIKSSKKDFELQRLQEIAELQDTLKTYEGRALVWRIMSHCKMFRSLTTDPTQIHREAGHQDVGLWLLSEVLTAAPEAYTIMRKEAVSRDTAKQGK